MNPLPTPPSPPAAVSRSRVGCATGGPTSRRSERESVGGTGLVSSPARYEPRRQQQQQQVPRQLLANSANDISPVHYAGTGPLPADGFLPLMQQQNISNFVESNSTNEPVTSRFFYSVQCSCFVDVQYSSCFTECVEDQENRIRMRLIKALPQRLKHD